MENREITLIGIAGASGIGKSTTALGLRDTFPDVVEVVHFDDFQKSNEDIIRQLGSIANWDHPDVTDFDKAYDTLAALKSGQNITVNVKNEFDNPDFIHKHIYERFSKLIKPKQLVIVEGHYVLYNKRVRGLLDLSIYLKGDITTSTARRTKGTDMIYNTTYLLPMFNKYILPTQQNADHTIDVEGLNVTEVLSNVIDILEYHLEKM